MTAIALIVDHEADLCRLIQTTLSKMGIKSDVAYSLAQAQSYWQAHDYDFCLTDLKLPDGSGLELVKQISNNSNVPVAVITAHGNIDLANEALKLGAFDFVHKPLELPRLQQLIASALKVITDNLDLHSQDTKRHAPEQQLLDSRLIGSSVVINDLKNTILKLARSQAPVFLAGASGTGKEVVARLIHDLSPRRDGCFVAVNCGAIPSELMESEFFGHKKGSFTGAVADKQGLFQQAHGGTLFLDEIADLPLAMQVKLLRAIQEKSVRAIGASSELAVDIRILSATHKNLEQLVQSAGFRQDLYYRINVIELKLPTLNARCADIPALAKHFLALIADEWQLEHRPQLTANAYQRLQQQHFTGNVRELRNVLERAITLADTSIIDVYHLGLPELDADQQTSANTASSAAIATNVLDTGTLDMGTLDMGRSTDTVTVCSNEISIKRMPVAVPSLNGQINNKTHSNLHSYRTHHQPYSAFIAAPVNRQQPIQQQITANTAPLADLWVAELPKTGLEAYLQQQEKTLIISALRQTNYHKIKAAKLLGTSLHSLRYRMKKLSIDEEHHID